MKLRAAFREGTLHFLQKFINIGGGDAGLSFQTALLACWNRILMARSDRTVLEPLSAYDLSTNSGGASIRSLAVCSLSDSLTIIYVGTHSGSLLLLSENPNPNRNPKDFDVDDDNDDDAVANAALKRSVSLLSSVSVGDSPVETVIVLRGIEKVVVLCDGSLFLVDWLLAQPVKRLSLFKGVSVISRRITTSDSDCSRLSVGSTGGLESSSASQRLFRKLGAGIKVNGTKTREPELPDSQGDAYLFAVVCGKRLILAELRFGNSRLGKIDREIDAVNGSLVLLKEMQCIDGVKTMVWLNDSIIVGTANGYSLFSSVTGQSGVIFTSPDEASLPLLKLLRKEKAVLLLVDNVGIVVNHHGQPIGGSFVFHSRPDSVAELSSHVVLVRDGRVELYHKKSASCIQTVVFGPEGVGPSIVANGENGNGKIIAVATSTKVICFRNVPAEEQIKDLLRKKNLKEAISLVEELECEGEISKELLSFVHAQVGFLLLFALHFEEAVDHFLLSETMQPSEIFPFIMRDPNRWSLLFPRNRYWGLHPPPAPIEDIVDDGLITIQRAIFLRKAGVDTEVDEDFLLNQPTRADLIQLAIKNMIRYLEVSRQKELALLVREGVDTLLMYLYRALNHVHDMEKLASSENYCIVEELETLLDDSGHLRTLAFLYASKGMSSKALAIWRILARNYSSGLWKDPACQSNSHDSNENVLSSREFAATEASKILEESPDQELVLQHLGWIAEVSPALVVQVLTSEKRTNQLSPDEVIITIDSKKVEILQRYLQWLIEDQGCIDTRFHTLYALSLAKSAIETFEEESTSQDLDNGRHEARFDDLGRNSIFQSPVRERLQYFLLSDLYDVEEVLDLIEGSELWLEKAILYRKLGQETLVLQILALKLEDSEAAEQYCAEIGRPEAYMQLLDMYLDPQNGKEPMFKAAVRLLHNHGESLDPLQVLETLSQDMPLQLTSDTILRMLRARFHHYRQGQIVHNLSRAVDIDTRLARLEERSRHVQINDESLCDSCHARLGTKLFAMYPDDTVVCYKCFRRQGESTSITGRDFKQDILFKPGWLVTR